jgi:hypothetical protein
MLVLAPAIFAASGAAQVSISRIHFPPLEYAGTNIEAADRVEPLWRELGAINEVIREMILLLRGEARVCRFNSC